MSLSPGDENKRPKMPETRFKIHLDREEVLEHLEKLGYKNISPEMLQEFMKDLKRLIKYDLKKSKTRSTDAPACSRSFVSFERSTSHEESSLALCSTPNHLHDSRHPLKFHQTNTSDSSSVTSSSYDYGSTKNSSCQKNHCCSSSDSSIASSSSSTASSENGPAKQAPQKRTKDKKKRSNKNLEPPRHDPVALYHYYQKFWKQFNLPEENRTLSWEVKNEGKRSAGDRLCF